MAFIPPKKGRTLSRNASLPERTSRTIDAVVPIIQQQNHHAIQAKGFPIYVYQRMTAGERCPCSFCNPDPLAPDLYDDTGTASEAQLEAIVQASRFSIEEYNPNAAMERQLRDVVGDAESETGFEHDEFDIPISLQPDALSAGACPICLGTGIKGGYTCLEAVRTVLTADDCTGNGLEVGGFGYPKQAKLAVDSSYADFVALLPSPPPNTKVSVRLMDGFEQRRGQLLVLDNSGWRPFDGFVRAGKTTFRVLKSNFSPSEVETLNFTHLEIMVPLVTKPDYADIPNLINAYDPLKVYPYAPSTFSLSPNMPALKAQDVIADIQHRLLWLVTSAAPTYAANGQIWHQNLEVRVIEPYEAAHSLLIPSAAWLSSTPAKGLNNGDSFTRYGGY